jgi:holo-[acyl-carrier protein] synthase
MEPVIPAGPIVSAVGVGVDLVDIDRVEEMLSRHGERAVHRLLTDGERSYCMSMPRPEQHIAARLAAKEAAYKALQKAGDARAVGWRDSEIVLNGDGSPTLQFHGRAAKAAAELKVTEILVSLTHSNHSAAAVVVLSAAADSR